MIAQPKEKAYVGYRGLHPPLFDSAYEELDPEMQFAMRECARVIAEFKLQCYIEFERERRAALRRKMEERDRERRLSDACELHYAASR